MNETGKGSGIVDGVREAAKEFEDKHREPFRQFWRDRWAGVKADPKTSLVALAAGAVLVYVTKAAIWASSLLS